MISVSKASRLLKNFRKKKILVVGDLMLDRYVIGSVSRISPEAPVPVVLVEEDKVLPGGAANVALNIQVLGGQASVAGLIGTDRAAGELCELFEGAGIETRAIFSQPGIKTTVKTRVLAERQQVVRVDREDPLEKVKPLLKKLCDKISEAIEEGVDGVIITDYGKGVIDQRVVSAVLSACKRAGVPVGYDPKDNRRLKISKLTLATPNYREALIAAEMSEGALPAENVCRDAKLKKIASVLKRLWNPDLLLITLGAYGMYLASRKDGGRIIPAHAREVFDVSGAGDTVIAAAMAGLVSGAAYVESAALANAAAGVVVGKVGTATCTAEELIGSLE